MLHFVPWRPKKKWIDDQESGTNFIQHNSPKKREFLSLPSFSLDFKIPLRNFGRFCCKIFPNPSVKKNVRKRERRNNWGMQDIA